MAKATGKKAKNPSSGDKAKKSNLAYYKYQSF